MNLKPEEIYPFKFKTWDYSEKNLPEFTAETSLEHVFKKPSSGFSGGMGIGIFALTAKQAQAGDIALIPKDQNSSTSGIIFELKRTDNSDKDSLTKIAEEALKQIKEKGYQHIAEATHVKEWLNLGIAFSGKAVDGV